MAAVGPAGRMQTSACLRKLLRNQAALVGGDRPWRRAPPLADRPGGDLLAKIAVISHPGMDGELDGDVERKEVIHLRSISRDGEAAVVAGRAGKEAGLGVGGQGYQQQGREGESGAGTVGSKALAALPWAGSVPPKSGETA